MKFFEVLIQVFFNEPVKCITRRLFNVTGESAGVSGLCISMIQSSGYQKLYN